MTADVDGPGEHPPGDQEAASDGQRPSLFPRLDDLESEGPFNGLPEVLTVEEAAQILRIGRNAAYEQAKRWKATGGLEGLPVVNFGRTLRVPRRALAQLMVIGVRKQPDVATQPEGAEM